MHPDLYLPPAKDHPFFSEEAVCAGGWSEFVARNFQEAPAAARWGKVTHHYMYGCPGGRNRAVGGTARATESAERIIPERIHAMFPDVKLIAILRDPVERCISDYGMRVLWGQQDRRSFDRTIADLLAPAALESSRGLLTHPFITWGEYGRILRPYYEIFAREQILSASPMNSAGLHSNSSTTVSFPRSPQLRAAGPPNPLSTDHPLAPVRLAAFAVEDGAEAGHPVVGTFALEAAATDGPGTHFPTHAATAVSVRPLEHAPGRLRASRIERGNGCRLRAHYESDRVLLEGLIGKPVPWAPVQEVADGVGTGTA